MRLSLFFSVVLISFVLVFPLSAENPESKDRLIGNILKNALETYHYKKIKIDDSISQKAFAEFLKKVDYGKQFLLKSDVQDLEKSQFLLDDQMLSGKHVLINKTKKLMEKRVLEIDEFRKDYFKKSFDFTNNDYLELDPEKREWPESVSSRKELWAKIFKQATLTRYLSLWEEQEELRKPKEKKKKKDKKDKKGKKSSVKKMTKSETLKKATEAISKKYERIFARIKKDDRGDYLEKLLNSIASIFDPHTVYMPPKKKEDFDIDISGSLEGIGAVLQEDGAYIKVVQIVPGGAAWRQKELEAEDVILMVGQGDGEPVSLVDMRVDDAVRYIRGKKGTEVRLTVKKVDGTRKVIAIVRDVVKISASYVKSSVIEHKDLKQKIGYIKVPKFYRDFNDGSKNCSDDVKKELQRLKKLNVDGVILDLRNNGGGALEDARIMSGLFIKEGPIVQIRNHKGQLDILRDYDQSVTYDGPLIVMINRFSASASEILAGAMQDYQRAVIVGGRYSHGKGTVQAVLNLNQAPLLSMFGPTMGALKVTIQKFYRVNGSSTQYKGITPDIIIPDQMGYAKNREQDLEYSLKWDKVKELKYNTWKGDFFDLDKLGNLSLDRVKKSIRFRRIMSSVDYLTKRREETKVSINETEVVAEDKKNKAITEKFKLDEENKKILVTSYEDSLNENTKIKKENPKQWKEDLKQRTEDWVSGIRSDVGIEESLNVMFDMIKQLKAKVSMRN